MKEIQLEASFHPFVNTRALYEVLLRLWRPTLYPTDASKQLVSSEILNKDGKLNEECREYLKALEGNMDAKPVEKDLIDLYHELSKKIHSFNPPANGIWCGGETPLRASAAIAILKLQSLCPEYNVDVNYCDNRGQIIARLTNGKVCAP